MKLAIYCAGGLGREVLELARSINGRRWTEIFFVDDITEEKDVYGARVQRWKEFETYKDDVEFVIANGEPEVRRQLYDKVKEKGYQFATIISAWAGIGAHSVIEEGCIIFDTGISVGVHLEANTLVNSRGIIGHDVVLGKHSIVGPMIFIGGKTSIGACSYIGPSAVINDRIKIGEYSIIGSGSVVVRNVKDASIVLGNPAKVIGVNTEKRVWSRF